jgi:DNA-binding CsgD family transcriptional regulator
MRRGRPPYPDLLTPREQEVLALLRQGLTNQQIAERLGISLPGARYHVSEILSKLGVLSRQEAASWVEPSGTRKRSAFAALFFAKTLGAVGAAAIALVIGLLALGLFLMSQRDSSPTGGELSAVSTPPTNDETSMLIQGNDGWTTYRNTAFEYEFRFPSDCQIESVETKSPAPIVRQRTTARCQTPSGQTVEITVTANLQGDWCGHDPQLVSDLLMSRNIVVSGVAGIEDVCYGQPNRCNPLPDCLQTVYRITRSFHNVKGQPNYVIKANDSGAHVKPEDEPLMRRIVESFQFLN